MWALMCCVCLVEADEFMRRRFAYNTICFIEFTNWIPLLTGWTKYLEWYEPGSHNQLSNAMFGNTCVIFCNSHIYFLVYLTQYSAHVLPFFWRHASQSFTFFTSSYIQSPLLCEILYRPLPSYATCCHDKASVSSLVTTRWRSSLLFIHAFLGLLAPVCGYLSGIYCFHLLTHPHPILQFTQPTWTIMWLSSLQPGDVPACNMHRSLP